ncbi:MAG: hypothetical protein IPK46_00265 [Saprospiraceae bacterium]|nr:hypothetical protein [Saprospiraceae bacterium]
MDKNTNVSVAADKRSYAWEGNRIGSGNMKVVGHEENKLVQYDLNFLKPYKSHANVTISLSPAEGGTLVNWSMASSLPFFLFFMKKSMEAYIGNDFERGSDCSKIFCNKERFYPSSRTLAWVSIRVASTSV